MRIGSSPVSAHRAGMSALWHDVDYVPEKRFETPVVAKMLQDFALPHEEHQLPEGVADPFKKLDQAFEVAAAQMERGIQGQAFLHGKPRPAAEVSDPRRIVDDGARLSAQAPTKGSAADRQIVDSVRADLDQARRIGTAAATPIAVGKSATKTAAQAESEAAAPKASGAGDVLDSLATFLPMAGGQAIQSVAQGPLPALATQAVTVASGVVGAAEVASVGIAEGLKEEEPILPRRGLGRTRDR